MSADIENHKEEEQKEPPKTPIYKRLLGYWQIGFKIVELIICIVCMGFVYEPVERIGLGKSQLHHVGIMYTTYTGYMLIIGAMLLGRALGDRIGYRTATVLSIAGSILFLVTGTVLTADRTNMSKREGFHPHIYLLQMLTTSIVFSFLNFVVFTIDGVLTFIRRQDF